MTLKLTGTDSQAGRRTDGRTDGQDHVLSQADALTDKKQAVMSWVKLSSNWNWNFVCIVAHG